jgi:hypothetical protein
MSSYSICESLDVGVQSLANPQYYSNPRDIYLKVGWKQQNMG